MSSRHRERLVKQLEASGALRTISVADAFLATPREIFIPSVADGHGIAAVYHDEPYPTKLDQHGDAISSSSQPGIMASMLEELRLSPGQRVLEIGAGTGYNAALLSLLIGPRGHVTSVELDPEVAREARRALRTIGRRARIVTGMGVRAGRKAHRTIASSSPPARSTSRTPSVSS